MRNASGRYYSRGDIFSGNGIRRLLTGGWPVRALMQSLREACVDPGPLIARRLGGDKAKA
jgi:hypothetical protein